MKRFMSLVVVLSAVLGTLFVNAFAEPSFDYRDYPTVYSKDEFETVLEDLKKDPYMSRYTENYKNELNQKIVNPYRIYSIDIRTFMETPEDKLEELIAMKPYSWVLPTINRNHYLMIFEEGQWRLLYYAEKDKPENSDSLIRFDNSAITSLNINYEKMVVYPIKITDDGFSNYLYLSDGNNRYMVLNSARPDLIPLKNQEAYSVDEIKSMLREVFPPQNTDEFLIGGGNTSKSPMQYGWIIVIAVLLVLATGVAVVYRRSKRLC